MGQLVNNQIEVLHGAHFATRDHDPELSPDDSSLKLWSDFMKISCDKIKCFSIVSCKDVSMILVVMDDGSHWAFEINFNWSHFFFITDNNFLYDMGLEIISM